MPIKTLEETFDIINKNKEIALNGKYVNGNEYELELVNIYKNCILEE